MIFGGAADTQILDTIREDPFNGTVIKGAGNFHSGITSLFRGKKEISPRAREVRFRGTWETNSKGSDLRVDIAKVNSSDTGLDPSKYCGILTT